VSRFGEQGDRVGDIATYSLDQRKAAQDHQREQQATLACFLGMMMTVVAPMSVVVMAAVPMLGVLSIVPVIAVTVTLRVVVIVPVLM